MSSKVLIPRELNKIHSIVSFLKSEEKINYYVYMASKF